MLYLSFLKRLTPMLSVNMVKRLQEVLGSARVINWSADQPFRHNLIQILTALCHYLKENNIQFVKTVDESEILFFMEVDDRHSYFLEIFNDDIQSFQDFLLKPKNLDLIRENPSLTLNLQKLFIELYFFVNLEKRINEILEFKRQAYVTQSDEKNITDAQLHSELLLMAANLNSFTTRLAHKKNFSDGGTTSAVFDDFQRFITNLNQWIDKIITANGVNAAPLANMRYEQAFTDPLFALGVSLLDYALSKSMQTSSVDYSPPQSLLALSSGAAHFFRMTQAVVSSAGKWVTTKSLSTEKIEKNTSEIWNMIEYYYRQFLSRKTSDFQANFDTAARDIKRTKQEFAANAGMFVQFKGMVKGNDFPRVLDAAQDWLKAMLANQRASVKPSDLQWIVEVDPAYFESAQPPSRELIQAKYKLVQLVYAQSDSAEAAAEKEESRVEQEVMPLRLESKVVKASSLSDAGSAANDDSQEVDVSSVPPFTPQLEAASRSEQGEFMTSELSASKKGKQKKK